MHQVVVEGSIPFLRGLAERYVDVRYLPSADFTPVNLDGAEALIVRSITACNAQTLPPDGLSIISTATAGYDHIDLDYCQRAGIAWCNAVGCNARSVGQYVLSALSSLALRDDLELEKLTVGIIGVGYAGRAVAELLEAVGVRTLLYDPPRAEREGPEGFATLEQVQQQSDVITLHVPLTQVGAYPTYHMVDRDFLRKCLRRPVLINACRGAVCPSEVLVWARRAGFLSALIIDCWEGEPAIDAQLLELADIASPHIAGFSADGKRRASLLALEAVCQHFSIPCDDLWQMAEPLASPSNPYIDLHDVAESWQVPVAMLSTLDLTSLTQRMKGRSESFETLRRAYTYPREMGAYSIRGAAAGKRSVLQRLGFGVLDDGGETIRQI